MNNKAEITDVMVQIQQMDLATILMLLSPTIIYYASKKHVRANYNLKKDFKIENVKTAALPIEVVRKFDNLHEEEILKKDFGDLILNFIKVVKENIPQVNDAILINNFNTISTSYKEFAVTNKLFNRHTAGQYVPIDNSIELSKTNYKITINHELLHALTTVIDPATGMIYCGFEQVDNQNNEFATGLNEGYTQYLAEKYFGKENSYTSAYVYHKKIAEILESIVGVDNMQTFYFIANLNGLVEYLKNYAPEEEIYKFIHTLDLLNIHFHNYIYTPSSKQIMKEAFDSVNLFLVKTALRKNILDNLDSNITAEEAINGLLPVLAAIPKKIKTKYLTIDFSNQETIVNALQSVIAEYLPQFNNKQNSK